MTHYLDRYMAGECEAVWRELADLGSGVRASAIYPEAIAVADELVTRVANNLERLYDRLLSLGYSFARGSVAFVRAGADDLRLVEETQQALGSFPLVVRSWFRKIHRADFTQLDEQMLSGSNGAVAGLGFHCPLVFLTLRECLRRKRELDALYPGSEEDGQFLPMGSVASNCEPKGFWLPSDCADGLYYNDGGGDMGLVDELRAAFRWGGFPFWSQALRAHRLPPELSARPRFEELLPTLTADMRVF